MVKRGSTCSGEKIKETLFYAAQDHGRLANAGTIADMYEIWQVTTQAWDGKVKGAASQLQRIKTGCSCTFLSLRSFKNISLLWDWNPFPLTERVLCQLS